MERYHAARVVETAQFFPVILLSHFVMGFGSYDESEQENQNSDAGYDDDDAVSVREHDHEGEVAVEGADSADELVDRLQDMK